MTEQMTRRDREQLAQVAKMRARAAKGSIDSRVLALGSQVEDELQALFQAEKAAEERAEKEAAEICRRANTDLTDRLEELGIEERFRPRIGVASVEQLQMRNRHESNASRRSALRTIANARIKALAEAARVEIDRQCATTVEQLITGGLDSDQARSFLEAMPTVDQLMLAPSVAELEAVHDEQRRERRQLMGGDW